MRKYLQKYSCGGRSYPLREGTVSGASDQYKTGGLSGDPETHRCTVPEEKYRV